MEIGSEERTVIVEPLELPAEVPEAPMPEPVLVPAA